MSVLFNSFFAKLMEKEGGYSDNPNDSGGKTRYGVTEAVARKNGYKGDMRALPLSLAQDIFKTEYWDINSLDQVGALSPSIALEMGDTGVNMGAHTAGEYLQIALNVMNLRGKIYPDLKQDGQVGPATVAALKIFLDYRKGEGEVVLIRVLNCQQGGKYISLCQARQKDEEFAFGWFANRII